MELRTLENVSLAEMTAVLNSSFADYFVPLQLTEAQFAAKLKVDSIDLGLSAGAFDDGKLVGSVLHGLRELDGELWLYNGGTGVIPSHRGRGLTVALFDFLRPTLEERGIRNFVLEVIDRNVHAINAYERIGYEKSRLLLCMEGSPEVRDDQNGTSFDWIDDPDWKQMQSYWDWRPTWQNTPTSLSLNSNFKTLGAFRDGEMVGYTVVYPEKGRVALLGVHPERRRSGIGAMILGEVQRRADTRLAFINVDAEAKASLSFLEKLGFTCFLRQYEMEMRHQP